MVHVCTLQWLFHWREGCESQKLHDCKHHVADCTYALLFLWRARNSLHVSSRWSHIEDQTCLPSATVLDCVPSRSILWAGIYLLGMAFAVKIYVLNSQAKWCPVSHFWRSFLCRILCSSSISYPCRDFIKRQAQGQGHSLDLASKQQFELAPVDPKATSCCNPLHHSSSLQFLCSCISHPHMQIASLLCNVQESWWQCQVVYSETASCTTA